MHFRFFDDLLSSAPEASPEFRVENGRDHSENNYSSNYLINVWKIYIKFAQKFNKCNCVLRNICKNLNKFLKFIKKNFKSVRKFWKI